MSYAEIDCSEKFPSGKSEYPDLQLHGRASDFSTLSFIQQKTSQFCRGRTSTNISIDQQRQREASEEAMRSATGEEFFGEIPEASSSSVDAREKSRQNAVPSHGRSIRGQDNALCFQFMYDGQHSGPVLSDENNNNVTPCSDGVSSEFYSANHSGVLPKATYSPHGSEIGGDFGVATSLGSDNHGCRSLENYFESMQALRSVSDSAHDPKENGSKPAPDSTAKIFHREKRLSDETYICSRAGDKQRLFGEHTEYSGGFIKSGHKTIQTALLSESREGDKNSEVKGKKNGEARHSLEGCNGGGVVDEAEILHPQANFRQRGFIHKLRQVEETHDSGLSHVNSMLISPEDQNGACSTEIDLSRELVDTGSDKVIGVSESPLKSFLSPEFMSPDHQSNLARRQSARSDFGGDMQSLPHNADANGSPDGSTSSGDALHHDQDIADGMGQGKSTADGNFHAENGSNDDWRKTAGSREGNASKSRENNSSQARQENGESPVCEEDSSLGKHIYPWMKESRQNARRKQSSSSNSSGSADKSSKRERTAYTNSQLVELEKEFHFNRYLCRPRRIEMAQMLNLTERQIKIWFQNRRMKYKKDQKLKTMPMSSLGRDGSFYHHQHHHHAQNMNSEALFPRNNDHRHYPHGGHVHSAETPYRQVPDGSSSAHGGLDCSSGGRCYHGHRPLGGHISQDSSNLIQQPLARTASNSYDGMNKTYSASNHKANSGGRLTSPSSSSSTGTLSPGNGRSSGGFGSEIAMRSTPSTGSEVQPMVQPGCGFLAHAVSPNAPNNGIDDESPILREKSTSGMEGRRLVNHPAYDMSFTGHGFSPFQRRMDDIAARMPFGNAATGIGQQISAMSNHYFGGYDRQKDPAALAMIVDPSTSVQQHVSGNSRYSQFHNPLDSLTDCVQRSRDFPHQTPNGGRYPHTDAYAASFTAGNTNSFDRNRYERSLETSPLDFSNRSKSSSPRTQHSEVYMHNRLTNL